MTTSPGSMPPRPPRIVRAGETTLTLPPAPASPPLRRADALADSVALVLADAALARAGWTRQEAPQRTADIARMAEEWAAGALPLAEIGRLSTPAERFVAMRLLPKPYPRAFLAMIDAVIEASPGPDGYCYVTRHGVFTEADVAHHKGTYRRDPATGEVAIVFPLRTKPSPTREDWT